MTHELGPLPSCDRDAGWHRIYTADQLRAYALAEVEKAVKAERERCAKLCELAPQADDMHCCAHMAAEISILIRGPNAA